MALTMCATTNATDDLIASAAAQVMNPSGAPAGGEACMYYLV